MILYFAQLLVFVGNAAETVRKNASQMRYWGISTNTRNLQEGIGPHTIPFYGDSSRSEES